MTEPKTTFEWSMYADATLAGLSLLVPFPFLDDVSESFFRRRIPKAVARTRGVELEEEVLKELGRGEGWWSGWAQLPKKLTLGLLKRLSRKLLYFLTIKDANEQLGYYWLSAFLIDYMIAAGQLDSPATAGVAREAMKEVLDATPTPLRQISGQVIGRAKHVWRGVRSARAGLQDEMLEQARQEMAAHWSEYEEYLGGVAARYEEAYQRRLEASVVSA